MNSESRDKKRVQSPPHSPRAEVLFFPTARARASRGAKMMWRAPARLPRSASDPRTHSVLSGLHDVQKFLLDGLAIRKDKRLPLLPAEIASWMTNELERNLFSPNRDCCTFGEGIADPGVLVLPFFVWDIHPFHLLFKEPGSIRSCENTNVGQ